MTYGNGARAEYGYDASGAVTKVSHFSNGGTLIASVAYSYDVAKNVAQAVLDDSLTYPGDAAARCSSYPTECSLRIVRPCLLWIQFRGELKSSLRVNDNCRPCWGNRAPTPCWPGLSDAQPVICIAFGGAIRETVTGADLSQKAFRASKLGAQSRKRPERFIAPAIEFLEARSVLPGW